MHSHDTKNATFLYNGDFSGDVIIIQESDVIRKPDGLVETHVRAKDLLSLVAQYVRLEKITALENASDEEILGLEVPKAGG